MPNTLTRADSVRYYLTGATTHFGAQTDHNASLGNHQSSTELGSAFNVASPISGLTVDFVSPDNGVGAGSLVATGNDTVKWTPPAATQGSNVTILNGETKTVEGADPNKYIRITRTSASPLSGTATVTVSDFVNNATGFDNLSEAERAAGDTEYRGICIENVSAVALAGVKVRLALQGTRQTTNVTQLPASGAGLIKTTGSFADWPDKGYVMILTSGAAVRESVYYSSRTADELTVPATGRALQGTSAAAGLSTDTVDAIPSIAIGVEAPNSQPSGNFQTIANESTAPTAVTFSQPVSDAAAINIGALGINNIYGIWFRRVFPVGGQSVTSAINKITTLFEGS